MNLEELGIDVEELRSQIIECAAQQVAEELSHKIQQDIRQIVEKDIGRKINVLVEEGLDGVYHPINNYGEAVGEPTTLRLRFKAAIETWWKTNVDKHGEPTGRYSGNPRYEYVARKVLDSVLTHNLKKDLEKLVALTKDQVKTGITESIREAIERTWGKD